DRRGQATRRRADRAPRRRHPRRGSAARAAGSARGRAAEACGQEDARATTRRRRLMFTGIIEEIGEIVDIAPSGGGIRLSLRAPGAVVGVRHGDSIAVSGVCLTVVAWNEHGFTADVMKQTLDM